MLMRNRRTFHASRLASLAMETRVRLLSWKLPRGPFRFNSNAQGLNAAQTFTWEARNS